MQFRSSLRRVSVGAVRGKETREYKGVSEWPQIGQRATTANQYLYQKATDIVANAR